MDFGSIASLASSITAAADITKTIIGGKLDQDVKIKTLELQQLLFDMSTKMMSLQTEYINAQDEVSTLKEQLKKQSDWEVQKKNYKLIQVSDGAFAYQANEMNDTNPVYCSNCFTNEKLSLLQYAGSTMAPMHKYQCHACDLVILSKNKVSRVI